ncbi:Uncharacterised protein [Mycobacteroides abscessus subsp. abscessus]|nr:Uncharacterised protein [Mycobacteroides abscessus subsp. abscessus]SHZ06954.1 Uncharacterised protein [Mycobacteroides abscessus subsp. abscessus]
MTVGTSSAEPMRASSSGMVMVLRCQNNHRTVNPKASSTSRRQAHAAPLRTYG